jgi:hypothetical protein
MLNKNYNSREFRAKAFKEQGHDWRSCANDGAVLSIKTKKQLCRLSAQRLINEKKALYRLVKERAKHKIKA